MNDAWQLAVNILDLFEEFLEAHEIIIPDDDRPPDNNTPLYGVTYGNLLNEVEEAIYSYCGKEDENESDKQEDCRKAENAVSPRYPCCP